MPKKYPVEITRTAEADIREIHEYISQDSEISADRWVEELERQIDTLERFPLRCHIIPEANDLGVEYRELIYGNYRTIIRVEPSRVIILRVIHSSRLLDMKVLG